MSNIQTGAERMPHDLSHLGFLAGQIGRLITISTTPVIAGDSFEMDAVGALRLSPLRRGLAIDSTVDIFTFYVPHRHVYGEQWIKFMKDGVNATPLPTVNTTGYIDHAAFLGTINPDTNKIPKHLYIAFDADPKFFACLVRFESSSVPTTLPTAYDVYPLDGRHGGGYYTVKDCVTIDVLPRTPGNNVYVGFMVWSNFTATKCRGLVSLNQVIKEIICLQPLK